MNRRAPQDHHRYSELYARKSDADLEALSTDYDSLPEAARSALKAELARRGMDALLEDIEAHELVTVHTFDNLEDAVKARGLLRSAGIDCFIFDYDGSFIWFPPGTVKIKVRPEDADAAKIGADFKDGVLKIHLPKLVTAKVKPIEVKVQ